MEMHQQTAAIPLAVAATPRERVDAGDRVTQLMDHPGWADLEAGVRAYQGIIMARLMGMTPTNEGAAYAGIAGELKGLATVKSIALGLIAQADIDAAEIREVEEGVQA
jgi:hypothetical protein